MSNILTEEERIELNRKVAVEVMKLTPSDRVSGGWVRSDGVIECSLQLDTDFAGTWPGMGTVIERMQELGWRIRIEAVYCGWLCEIWQPFGHAVYRERRDTAPEAVALAALAALGGGINHE